MGLNVQTTSGDKLMSGGKLTTPGWYHANITKVNETDRLDGIEIHGTVLAGKPEDASVTEFIDSSFKITLKYADASKGESSQEFANARLTAFLIAADLIAASQLGQPVDVNEQAAVGRHVLVHLRWGQKKVGTDPKTGKDLYEDNPPWVELAFKDILHIDDPDGANVPKNIAALKFVPPACRHTDPKYFAFKAKPSAAAAGSTAGVGNGSPAAGSTAAAGAAF